MEFGPISSLFTFCTCRHGTVFLIAGWHDRHEVGGPYAGGWVDIKVVQGAFYMSSTSPVCPWRYSRSLEVTRGKCPAKSYFITFLVH